MPQDSASSGEGEPAQGPIFGTSAAHTDSLGKTTTESGSAGTSSKTTGTGPGRTGFRDPLVLALIVVIVAVIVVAAGYTLLVGIHRSSASSGQGIVLVPYGTSYSLPLDQFAGIAFHVNSTSSIQGKINSSEGAVLDIMTPAEFDTLAVTLNVSGYEWTSGKVADQTIYDAVIPVPPGQWYLAFLDANPSFPTGIAFYSNLTLTTG